MTAKDPVWIEERDVLTLHDRPLAFHGGAAGLRNLSLLQSALARSQQRFAYSQTAGLIEMAAAYTAEIVKKHPFVDGNKRTGFVVGILLLELNGYRFSATEPSAAEAVLALAAGNLDEAGYAAFLCKNVAPE